MNEWHDPNCVCGRGIKRFGIACLETWDDPQHPCSGNSDDEVAEPPTHLCSVSVPFTHSEHRHLGVHHCECGFEWGSDV